VNEARYHCANRPERRLSDAHDIPYPSRDSKTSAAIKPAGAGGLGPKCPGIAGICPLPTVVPSALPGLTTREHEILGYLVAGSTYAEIANILVISEKTVSSHVSNLLRKTHTSSRVELAQLAHRVAQIEPRG
jgi:DNA-binding CsgD family transcriptional regulator